MTDTAAQSGLPTRVAVVVGSTRPNRICDTVATWVLRHLTGNSALRCELIDLAGPSNDVLRRYRAADREHVPNLEISHRE